MATVAARHHGCVRVWRRAGRRCDLAGMGMAVHCLQARLCMFSRRLNGPVPWEKKKRVGRSLCFVSNQRVGEKTRLR